MKTDPRLATLEAFLENHAPLAVAFSGGVDSTFLLAVAARTLSDRVLAVTVDSPLFPRRERDSAVRLAVRLGVRHLLLHQSEDALDAFRDNPVDRCYICKKLFLARILQAVRESGFPYLAHGANVDDLEDYRPGHKAAAELDVLAPLVVTGFGKSDIRFQSRRLGLPTWNRPSMACLATRIPYGEPLTAEALRQVETAEDALCRIGFDGVRVRRHGPVARVEMAGEDMDRAMRPEVRREIVACLRAAGFRFVAMDLEGYATGRMNRDL